MERGIDEVVVAKGPGLGGPERLARCSPVVLPLSRQTRLERLHRHALYKQGSRQLQLPLRTGSGDPDLATQLSELLVDLVPVAHPVGGPVAS